MNFLSNEYLLLNGIVDELVGLKMEWHKIMSGHVRSVNEVTVILVNRTYCYYVFNFT